MSQKEKKKKVTRFYKYTIIQSIVIFSIIRMLCVYLLVEIFWIIMGFVGRALVPKSWNLWTFQVGKQQGKNKQRKKIGRFFSRKELRTSCSSLLAVNVVVVVVFLLAIRSKTQQAASVLIAFLVEGLIVHCEITDNGRTARQFTVVFCRVQKTQGNKKVSCKRISLFNYLSGGFRQKICL